MKRTNNLAFIIGTGRSGTTVLSQILNAHSKICVPHELQIIFGYSGNGPRLHELFLAGENLRWQAKDLIQIVEELCPYKFEKFFDYASFFRHQKYPIESLGHLLIDLYNAVVESRGKEIFLEQTPWYGQRLDIMKELFPNAKFIHMIRDGRDVALSFSRTPWWHKSPIDNLDRWQREIDKISQDATLLLDKQQYLEVKYEDLVLDPDKIVPFIVDFIGVKFEKKILLPENLLDYAMFRKVDGGSFTSNSFKNWNAKREKVVFSESVYNWKNNNFETFVNISDQVRMTMKKFGYEVNPTLRE